MKKLFIMLMTGLTISTAAVSCNEREEDVTIKTDRRTVRKMVEQLSERYNHDVKIDVRRNGGDGSVENYYVYYVVDDNTVVHQYDVNGNFIDVSTGKDYFDAVRPFAVLSE